MIDVDHRHGEAAVLAAGEGDLAVELLVEHGAVEQAREAVAGGEQAQLPRAQHEGGGEGRRAHELGHAPSLSAPVELPVNVGGEGRRVEIPPPVRVEHDAEVLAEGESARNQADAGVVAQAGGGDGEKVDGEDREVVRRLVRPAEEQREGQHGAHQADVEDAAGEADPGAPPVAAGGGVNGERQPQAHGGGGEQGDDVASPLPAQQGEDVAALLVLKEELAQREEDEDDEDQQAKSRHQQLAAEAGAGDLLLRRAPDATP